MAMMDLLQRLCLVLVFVAGAESLAMAQTDAQHGISRLVVFGDSLSDMGGRFARSNGDWPPSPPYYLGRQSNGPVWVEYLNESLDLAPLQSSMNGGSNYAFIGAETGAGTTDGVPNMGEQVTQFLSGDVPADGDLFVFWGGPNDLAAGQLDVSIPVENLISHVSTLADVGAKRFLFANLPPLGQLPATRSTFLSGIIDNATNIFNDLLDTRTDQIEAELGLDIRVVDIHSLFENALNAPEEYGFLNVTDGALNETTGVVVGNPDDYLFWDSAHPTTRAHMLVADAAFEQIAVPEPSSLYLATVAMCGLVFYLLQKKRDEPGHATRC